MLNSNPLCDLFMWLKYWMYRHWIFHELYVVSWNADGAIIPKGHHSMLSHCNLPLSLSLSHTYARTHLHSNNASFAPISSFVIHCLVIYNSSVWFVCQCPSGICLVQFQSNSWEMVCTTRQIHRWWKGISCVTVVQNELSQTILFYRLT
jgi:hypothetical protein